MKTDSGLFRLEARQDKKQVDEKVGVISVPEKELPATTGRDTCPASLRILFSSSTDTDTVLSSASGCLLIVVHNVPECVFKEAELTKPQVAPSPPETSKKGTCPASSYILFMCTLSSTTTRPCPCLCSSLGACFSCLLSCHLSRLHLIF